VALCQDPEVSYLNSLGYNVVAEPTATLSPLEVLGQNSDGVLDLGPLSSIWTTTAAPPAISAPQQAASISGGQTSNLSVSIGLSLLSGIVTTLGGQTPGLSASYGSASSMQFTLGDVTVSSVTLTDLGAYLEAGDVNMANPAVAPYFQNSSATVVVVYEILQSNSITVTTTAAPNATLSIDSAALSQAVGGNLTIGPVAGQPSSGSTSTLVYTGNVPLTFAFKALHIAFVNGQWQLLGDDLNPALGTLGAPAPTSLNPVSLVTKGLLSIAKVF
jgi:hypothetical protein